MSMRRLLLLMAMFAAGRAFVNIPAAGLSSPSRVTAALSRRLCGDSRIQVPCFILEAGRELGKSRMGHVNVGGMCNRERVLVCGLYMCVILGADG